MGGGSGGWISCLNIKKHKEMSMTFQAKGVILVIVTIDMCN